MAKDVLPEHEQRTCFWDTCSSSSTSKHNSLATLFAMLLSMGMDATQPLSNSPDFFFKSSSTTSCCSAGAAFKQPSSERLQPDNQANIAWLRPKLIVLK